MAIEDLDLEFEEEEEEQNDDAIDVDVDLSFSASADSNKKANANNNNVGNATSMSADDATDPNLSIPSPNKPKTQSPTAKRPSAQKVNSNRRVTQKVPPTQKPTAKPTQKSEGARGGQNNVANIADHPGRSASQKTPPHAGKEQAKVTTQQVQRPVQAPVELEDYQYELDSLRLELAELKEKIQVIEKNADLKVAVAEAKSEFMLEYVSNSKLLDHQVNQVLQRIHKKVPALKNEVLTIKKYMTEFMQKNTKKK